MLNAKIHNLKLATLVLTVCACFVAATLIVFNYSLTLKGGGMLLFGVLVVPIAVYIALFFELSAISRILVGRSGSCSGCSLLAARIIH